MAARPINKAPAGSILYNNHAVTFSQALKRVLTTTAAEEAFSEIIDGLPTIDTFYEFHHATPHHPVFGLRHETVCDDSLDRMQYFRSSLDPMAIELPVSRLQAFQQAQEDTKDFELRLLGLLAESCHSLAADLYERDEGNHTRHEFDEWRDSNPGRRDVLGGRIQPTPFYHDKYTSHWRYPRGVADMVGYWVEAKIFGGVVLFDRGDSQDECRDLFLHAAEYDGPRTIFPATPTQYQDMVRFLLGPSDRRPRTCPLPIRPTSDNRWRFHSWEAKNKFNIFRDQHERLPVRPREPPRQPSAGDWPELLDHLTIKTAQRNALQEIPADRAEVEAALEGLKCITPSSPMWEEWHKLSDPATSDAFTAEIMASVGLGDELTSPKCVGFRSLL